jgi:trigger factor
MGYELEETGDLTRRAIITVSGQEFRSEEDDALRSLRGDVDLEGFREGKVPLNVIRSRYGDQVRGEIIEQFVQKRLQEVLEDYSDRLLNLDQPEVLEVPDPEGEGELKFAVEFELRPDIDPVGYLGLEVEKPEPDVDDDEVDEQLEQLREEHARLEPIELRETIKEGDVVTFDFDPVDDRPELQDFTGEDVEAEVGQGEVLPGIEEALEGADIGGATIAEIEADQRFPIEELRGETIELNINVKSAKQKILPELNDEFAKDTGEARTLLDLRSQIRDQLRDQQDHRARHVAEQNLMDELLEQNDFEVPPQFLEEQVESELERRTQMYQQQGIDLDEAGIDTESLKSNMRGEVEQSLKTEFVLLAIAEKEQLEVEDRDLDEFFEHQAQHDERVTAEELKRQLQQDEERWEGVQYQVLMEKTKSYLLDEAEFVEGEWPEPEQPGAAAAAGAAETSDEDDAGDETSDEEASETDDGDEVVDAEFPEDDADDETDASS